MIKVFISYSHDSDAHREQVLALSERLRADGIDTILDRYVKNGSPPEGWPRWMMNKLDDATHVLCVCTETYYRRFRGHEIPDKGKGVDWEGSVITQELYDQRNVSNKFIPVLFSASDEHNIPEPLRMQTLYLLNSEESYQSLYDALLDQGGVEPRTVGELKRKARATGKPLTFDSKQSAPLVSSAQRHNELIYLEDLINKHYAKHEQCYVALEATEHRSHSLERKMQTVMSTDVILKAFKMASMQHEQVQETSYSDALEAYRDLKYRDVRRLALLGEPGAGKSFSLQRIAVEYAQQAVSDENVPLPVLVPLGAWTSVDESLETFITAQLGQLGRWFSAWHQQRRVALMLDGLNEVPPGQRKVKIEQIKSLTRDERFVSVVVSCREKDFNADCYLPFDTLLLQPLKPSQILTFLKRMYVLKNEGINAAPKAENFFWQLAGGQEVQKVWEVWQQAGADLELFWSVDEVPIEAPNIYTQTTWKQNSIWRKARFNPRNLLHLASNPYLLELRKPRPVGGVNKCFA